MTTCTLQCLPYSYHIWQWSRWATRIHIAEVTPEVILVRKWWPCQTLWYHWGGSTPNDRSDGLGESRASTGRMNIYENIMWNPNPFQSYQSWFSHVWFIMGNLLKRPSNQTHPAGLQTRHLYSLPRPRHCSFTESVYISDLRLGSLVPWP